MGACCSSSTEVWESTLGPIHMADNGIADLDQLVKVWAADKGERLNIKNAKKSRVEVVWERVTFSPAGEPEWKKQRVTPQPPNRTVYTSSFCNKTDEKAQHTLRVERTSSATSVTSLSSGYTTTYSLGLSLSLPYEVASATAGFGRSVEVVKAEETTREEVQTWSVDTVIPSPAWTLTRATMEVKESRWKGDFRLPVIIKGVVVVNFYDQNTPGNYLGTIEEDVGNLLPQFGAVREAGRQVVWVVRGTCDFVFGVEQVISVQHEAIRD